MMRMMLASSLALALIVTAAANAEASLEPVVSLSVSSIATPGDDADALRPVRVLSELSSASSPIKVHTGNDYSTQASAWTGQTVVWGASSDGLIFVENEGAVLYAIYDPEVAGLGLTTGVDWNAAEIGTVNSPTECPDISSLFIDGGDESTLFFLKSKTLFCSCEWTESSKCPAVLSVKSVTTKRDEDKPLSTTTTKMNTTTELVVSGNSMVPILSVDPAITAPLSFSDPSNACEPLLNPAEANGTIW